MEAGTLRSAKEGLCASCYAKAAEKCSKCKQRWYCSQECQVKDWHLGHKGDCGLADLPLASPPRPPARLLAESVERPVHSEAGWRKLQESCELGPKSGRPRGLRNVANCCYMNALLQSLYHSVPLLHSALKQHSCARCADDAASSYGSAPCFRCDLAQLSQDHLAHGSKVNGDEWRVDDVVELHGLKQEDLNGRTGVVVKPLLELNEEGEAKPLARVGVLLPGKKAIAILPQNLRYQFNGAQLPAPPNQVLRWLERLGEEFTFGAQEDTHEFFNSLLRLLEDEELKEHARRVRESENAHLEPNADLTALPSRIFGGLLVSQCTCTRRECAASTFSFEPFRDLSLEITEATDTLEDMLRLFTSPERLDKQNSWKCESCTEVVRARKQITIYSPPNFLVLHLKRFRYLERGKVTKIVPFPQLLNLRPFLCAGAPDEGRPVNYDLRAVVVHVDKAGYSHFGHYIAFVKCLGERKGTFRWFLIDDSHTQEAEESQVLQQQAYLLFYVRTGSAAAEVPKARSAAGEGCSLPSRCQGRHGAVCSFFACAEGLCTRCYQEEHGRPPPTDKNAGEKSNGYPASSPSPKPSSAASTGGKTPKSAAKPSKKVGANDPCPCGSGKKYKKCHGGA
ncbi:unnamed protein product [Effrenium voratum]|nr:unnamed protein product [Effrenium voratum]